MPEKKDKEGIQGTLGGEVREEEAGSGRLMLLTLFLLPHLQLLRELGQDEEGLPALTLLGLENVAVDVVPHIEDVLPFHV